MTAAISSIASLRTNASGAASAPDLSEEHAFDAHLQAASSQSEVREAAEGLVASAFLVPVLASLRENSQASGPFAPSMAERRFGPLLDQRVADQVIQGTNFALIDSIVDRYVQGAAP